MLQKNKYGEKTSYVSIDGIEWDLFYVDTENVYLITKNGVRNEYLPIKENGGFLIKGTRDSFGDNHLSNAYFTSGSVFSPEGEIMENQPWSMGIDSSTITNNPLTKDYLKWVNNKEIEIKRDTPGLKALAYMMDVSQWSNFAGEADGAYAIGGPTLEIFVKSYNAKHESNKLGEYDVVNGTNSNVYGYKVKLGDNNWSNYLEGLDKSDSNFWTCSNYGYYLSSPSSESNYLLVCVTNEGKIDCALLQNAVVESGGHRYMSGGNLMYRPLVVIPKTSIK